ncbi:hypothetical protein HELRODRAFT_169234 [Helobdella robusta]|uniref:Uncharacterized protein n=1 Tax=Helobdella robusta TaxID=6412 RepID=T1F1L9_HELRO|nr:hypothetical protein HELRODRAFT_169234 [Helobdella robusta]ESO08401.1 hypothetical protein HELRODRAFT_169234 [Helobdella robusta]
MALSIRQKRVRRIPGDPIYEVAVQGPVDGLATGTPLYSVAVQGTMGGRITCRPRGWRFGTWNVGTLTGKSLEVVEELQRRCGGDGVWKGNSEVNIRICSATKSGEHRSMIDYILIRAKHKKYVKNGKAISANNSTSDVDATASSPEQQSSHLSTHPTSSSSSPPSAETIESPLLSIK